MWSFFHFLPTSQYSSRSSHLTLYLVFPLTIYLLTWRIWRAPKNASKGQMGFDLAFKGLIMNFRLDSIVRITNLSYSLFNHLPL